MKNPRNRIRTRPRLVHTQTDSWMNIVTGLNIPGKDKSTGAEVDWMRLDRHTQESLFSADDLGGKIARIIPFDGTREGITWVIPNKDEQDPEEKVEIIDFLNSEFARLAVWETYFWAWTMARVEGGSLVLVVVDDGQELSEPLDTNRIRKINNLVVMERWDIIVNSGEIINDINDPLFGTPEYYQWNTGNILPEGGEIVRIHNSRVIRFDGDHLPRRLYVRNDYWHDSIYSRLIQPMKKYTTSMENVGNIMQDFNQAIYKLEGLTESVAQDESELVVSKLEFVNLMRSTNRALVLDKEDEFDFMQSGVSGLKDLIDKIQERLTAASDIPHTRLLGESPGAALGETGKSELIDYYDTVAARQEIKLRRPIGRITDLIFAQIESTVEEPDDWNFTFDPLFQQDQESIIRTRNIQANTDQIYMQNGVYDSFEVARSRFGTGEYSFETHLDPERIEAQEEMLEGIQEQVQAVGEQQEMVTGMIEEEGAEGAATESIVAQVDPTQLLNVAQVASLLSIVEQVTAGTLPKAAARSIIIQSFGMSDEQVNSILDNIPDGGTNVQQTQIQEQPRPDRTTTEPDDTQESEEEETATDQTTDD